MRRHQSVAEALQRILIRGKQFVFDTIAGILMPQPWAVGFDGALLGHLLTVDDALFDSVADECLVEILTLPEAFDRPWADLNQRSLWIKAYVNALRSLADREEQKDRALRQREDLGKLVDDAMKGD